MNQDDVDRIDRNRRHFLTVATAVTGAVGVGALAVPFLSSLKPSARAQALGAPVEVPLGSIQPGEMVRVLWRGKLVFVLRRDESMLGRLQDSAFWLMMLRLQKERMDTALISSDAEYFNRYGLTVNMLDHHAPKAVVMDPGPLVRGVQMEDALTEDPDRSLILNQVANGIPTRMAVLDMLVGN